jgi:hypothetical protein
MNGSAIRVLIIGRESLAVFERPGEPDLIATARQRIAQLEARQDQERGGRSSRSGIPFDPRPAEVLAAFEIGVVTDGGGGQQDLDEVAS